MGAGHETQNCDSPVTCSSEPPGEYASITNDDDVADHLMQLWRRRWKGRILVWRIPLCVIYIGPHWYCSAIMLSFIVGVGYCFTVNSLSTAQLFNGVAVTVLSTLTFLRCALSNPGIVDTRKAKTADETGSAVEQGRVGTDALRPALIAGRKCNKCNVVPPPGSSHCDFCQVCVEGHDHHCPWMGKCIGKNNLYPFYIFICTSMGSLAYVFASTLLNAGPRAAGNP